MPTDQSIVLLHVFSTFAVGGPEIRFTRLANQLGSTFKHILIAMDGIFDSRSLIDPDIDITYVKLPVKKGRRLSLSNLLNFRRELVLLRPALLLSYNWGAVEWGLVNRFCPVCPHIHFEDGFGPEEANGRQISRRVWFRRIAFSGGTKIIVPSRLLQRIATGAWGFPSDRVIYIPNGIDIVRYNQDPDLAMFPMLSKNDGEVIIGTVGTLRAEKNFARLIRIFAKLPVSLKAKLVIAGDGPERTLLEKLASGSKVADRIIFLGYVSEPQRILRSFDVFVITSDTEQMPLTLLEAMAAHLPVVSTDVGDIRCIVAPENRLEIVPVGDEDQFIKRLVELLNDKQRRINLGIANYSFVENNFSESQMVKSYLQLFKKEIIA